MDKKLVVVSGPSGVGKGPIIEWLKKLYMPNLAQVQVRKTRPPRPNEKASDMGFEGKLGPYIEYDCRGSTQRIYEQDLSDAFYKNDTVLLEAYHVAVPHLKNAYAKHWNIESVFISPVTKQELEQTKALDRPISDYVYHVMADALYRRAAHMQQIPTFHLKMDLHERASDAADEIELSSSYDHIIYNSCYEADVRWKLPFLVGEPKRVVKELKEIIEK